MQLPPNTAPPLGQGRTRPGCSPCTSPGVRWCCCPGGEQGQRRPVVLACSASCRLGHVPRRSQPLQLLSRPRQDVRGVLLQKPRVPRQEAVEALFRDLVPLRRLEPEIANAALHQDLNKAGATASSFAIDLICLGPTSVLQPGDLHLHVPLAKIMDRLDCDAALSERHSHGGSPPIELRGGRIEPVPIGQRSESASRFLDEGIGAVLVVEGLSVVKTWHSTLESPAALKESLTCVVASRLHPLHVVVGAIGTLAFEGSCQSPTEVRPDVENVLSLPHCLLDEGAISAMPVPLNVSAPISSA